MNNRAEARINLEAVKSNAANIISVLNKGCELMAVVKANAYGHGAVPCARALESIGVRYFAVATADEGAELREGGVGGEILVLSKTPLSQADKLLAYNLTQTCDSVDYVKTLSGFGRIKIHLKIDTGMSRMGFYCHDLRDVEGCAGALLPLFDVKNIEVDGIFMHFADADGADRGFTDRQFAAFTALVSSLESKGKNLGLRHCCNSAAAIRYPEMHLGMVRCGIGLYGLERSVPGFPFVPAMSVYASLSAIHTLRPGDTVSYGRTFTAEKPMRIGTVSFGYADGMPRLLSNRYSVTVNNKKAPVIGRVCMDMFSIDITDIDCNEGDEALIFGENSEVNEIADTIGTINYEIVCGVSVRVPRVY